MAATSRRCAGANLAISARASASADRRAAADWVLLGASFFLPSLPEGPHSPFMALPYHLFIMSTQAVDTPERIPWGTALVLVTIALGLNTIASIFRSRARAGRKW